MVKILRMFGIVMISIALLFTTTTAQAVTPDPNPNTYPANQPGVTCSDEPGTYCAQSSPDHFALACDFSNGKRARVDFREFDVYLNRNKVDANGILYRSLNLNNTPSSFSLERVNIQVYNRAHITGPETAGAWENWTGRGGTGNDGQLVSSRIEYDDWDPQTHFNSPSYITDIRMGAWGTWSGGQQLTCISPVVKIS